MFGDDVLGIDQDTRMVVVLILIYIF